jgi:hypothetical protein
MHAPVVLLATWEGDGSQTLGPAPASLTKSRKLRLSMFTWISNPITGYLPEFALLGLLDRDVLRSTSDFFRREEVTRLEDSQ